MFFEPGKPPADYVQLIKEGVEKAKKEINEWYYDLVILDEINVAVFFELITEETVLDSN